MHPRAGNQAFTVYFLAGPDLSKSSGIFEPAKSDSKMVQRTTWLKKLGFSLCDIMAGRRTHQVAMRTGGFTFVHKAIRPMHFLFNALSK